MKRFWLVLVMVLLASTAQAASPIQLWDDVNKHWINAQCDASGTLKVVGSISASLSASSGGITLASDSTGAVSVAPKGATSVLTEAWTLGPTAASWTMTASATDIALWGLGTGTAWLNFNSGGATVGVGIPLVGSFTLSRDAAPGMVVWGIASVTVPTTRAEGRR